MPGFWIPMLILAIAGPAYFIWSERRAQNPAVCWKKAAAELRLQFQAPAALVGRWKERELAWRSEPEHSILSCRYAPKRPVRLEIGLKEEVEKRAGIIVPDRVELQDSTHSGFEERYIIRCTPLDAGATLADQTVRRKFAEFSNAYLMAANGSIQARFPPLLKSKDLREAMDIAVSLAETLELV